MTDVLPYSTAAQQPLGHNSISILSTVALACPLLEFPALLLLGVSHPRVPMFVPVILIALPVCGFLLGLMVKGMGGKAKDPRASRARAGVALAGVELVIIFLASIVLPSMCVAREPSNRVKCSSNLRQIGLACLMYANAHEGHFPPDIDAIVRADISAECFVCPSSSDDRATGATTEEVIAHLHEPHHVSYVYVGSNLMNTESAETVVAYENMKNHSGTGMNVLYGDGHVEFQSLQSAKWIASELESGHNPPRQMPETYKPTGK